jgi:outer membrane cobalamin receptor
MKIMPLTAACAGALAASPAADAFSQEIADTVVVTATRVERPTFDLPLSIDSVGAARIHEHQAGSISRSRSSACRARWYRTASPTPRSSR